MLMNRVARTEMTFWRLISTHLTQTKTFVIAGRAVVLDEFEKLGHMPLDVMEQRDTQPLLFQVSSMSVLARRSTGCVEKATRFSHLDPRAIHGCLIDAGQKIEQNVLWALSGIMHSHSSIDLATMGGQTQ